MKKNNFDIVDSNFKMIATEERLEVFKAATMELTRGSKNFDIFEYLEIFRLTVFLAWAHAISVNEINYMLSLLTKNIVKYRIPYEPLVAAEILMEAEVATEIETEEFLEKYGKYKEELISYLKWRESEAKKK